MKRFLPIAVLALIILWGCAPPAPRPTVPTVPPAAPPIAPPTELETGTAVFAVTDKAMSLAGVTTVRVTIDNIRLIGPAGPVDVAVDRTVNLLELKNQQATALLAEKDVKAGEYNQLQLTVSRALVTVNGKDEEAKLPSNVLRIVGKFVVNTGEKSAALFDFDLDKSLHKTGAGNIILAPVIKLTTSAGASIERGAEDRIIIRGGRPVDSKEVGMNENGEVGEGKRIDPTADLEIENGQIVKAKKAPPAAPPGPPTQPSVKEFTIEADDNGFYPSGILNVNKGDTVKITFKVRTSNVYFGGLDFRSEKFTTQKVPPGGETTVEFVADKTFRFTSYWPNSGTKKADGQVVVQG